MRRPDRFASCDPVEVFFGDGSDPLAAVFSLALSQNSDDSVSFCFHLNIAGRSEMHRRGGQPVAEEVAAEFALGGFPTAVRFGGAGQAGVETEGVKEAVGVEVVQVLAVEFHRVPLDLAALRISLANLSKTAMGLPALHTWGGVASDAIVGRTDGAIPQKYRELLALAVACTTQCPYCLDVHTRGAKRAGATREEVAEVAFLAAALRAGAAVTHGALTLKLFDKL